MQTREEKLSTRYEYIFSLSKPRRVQVNAVAQIIIGSLPIASIFLIYSGVQTMRAMRQINTQASLLYPVLVEFVFPAILIAISSATYWKVRRDKALLRDGDLAIGVVTHQKLVPMGGGRGGRRKQSRIRYRFKDPAGQLFQGTGTDRSQRLQVNMTVPVFYKAENPEKNVSICAATCELRTD
jgi:hypothetical protein